jgi:hypothetical protein
MELPLELWEVISQGLSVRDKCSLLTTCSAIKQVLYNDPLWLDFTLKNLQRGLTVKEIVTIVFLKADQERIAKSRISKIQNHVRVKFGSSHDIEAILAKQKSIPSSVVKIGRHFGVAWREWSTYIFSCNFVALFCRPETLDVKHTAEKNQWKNLLSAHGGSIKHLSLSGYMQQIGWHLTKSLTSLESAVLPEFSVETNPLVMNNLPASITKLEVASSNGRDLIALTRLTQLRSFKEENDRLEYPDMPLILKSLGPHLESLKLPVLSEQELNDLATYCTKLHSLWLFDIKPPPTLFGTLAELAKKSTAFPKRLRLKQKKQGKKPPPPLAGADLFFKDFGHRLTKLVIDLLDYAIIPHISQATNLVSLELSVMAEQSKPNGVANVAVPQVILQLPNLVELTLKLATTHQTILNHAHITKLSVDVRTVVINVPSLVELDVLGQTFNVDVNDCALKKLSIGKNVHTFFPTNVNWSALEKIFWGTEHLHYWNFVDTHLPADVTLKSAIRLSHDTTFRITQNHNKSLMPESARFEWFQQDDVGFNESYAVPRELSLHGAPHNGLQGYQFIVNKFATIESLDFYHCHDLSSEGLDIIFQGLANLKQIGFTESRDVAAPFSHLKVHSKSLELLYLYHIHSVETCDIVCPNLCTITFDNAGRYNFLEDVGDTNLCEMTLQQIGETDSCPNLVNYHAYPTQTNPQGMYDITEPKKPVKLTKIPIGLMCLSLYLNSNLISVDLESDSLTEFSVTCCYHVKSIRLIANVHTFSITDDMPLDTLVIDSKVLQDLQIPVAHLHYVELRTPKLRQLTICSPASDHFLDHLTELEELNIYAHPHSFRINGKHLFAKLENCCPRLKVLSWDANCFGLPPSQLVLLKKAFKLRYNTELELRGPEDVMTAVEQILVQEKLPQKKQRMLKINAAMKRTIVVLKQQPKVKAFRAWRDYALRDKKQAKEKKQS